MNVETREKLYEGKAKIVYETDRPGVIVQYFKDDATAFNALKKGTIVGKGVINNRMSAALFEVLGFAFGFGIFCLKVAPRRPTRPIMSGVARIRSYCFQSSCSF